MACRAEDAVDQLVGAVTIGMAQMVIDPIATGRGEVEALVEHVAGAEARADKVPRQAKQRGAIDGVKVVGTVEKLVGLLGHNDPSLAPSAIQVKGWLTTPGARQGSGSCVLDRFGHPPEQCPQVRTDVSFHRQCRFPSCPTR